MTEEEAKKKWCSYAVLRNAADIYCLGSRCMQWGENTYYKCAHCGRMMIAQIRCCDHQPDKIISGYCARSNIAD